jgi:hypothetical protein
VLTNNIKVDMFKEDKLFIQLLQLEVNMFKEDKLLLEDNMSTADKLLLVVKLFILLLDINQLEDIQLLKTINMFLQDINKEVMLPEVQVLDKLVILQLNKPT